MRRLQVSLAIFALTLTTSFSATAAAQLAPAAPPSSARPSIFLDGALGTPRAAVTGYLAAARAGNYARASSYLDLSDLTPSDAAERGATLARQFKIVLDRKLWIDVESISDHPQGRLDDGLPEDRERIGVIPTREGPVDVRVRSSVDPATGVAAWRFSPLTVELIPGLYDEFGPGPFGYRMPPALYKPRLLEIELWQWLGLVIVGTIAYGIAALVTALIYALIRRRAKRAGAPTGDRPLDTVRGPMRLLVALGVFLLITLFVVRLPIPARRVLLGTGRVFMVVLVTWMLIKLTDALWIRTRERLQREDRRSSLALAMLAQRFTRAALVILGAIVVLQQIGFNVNGILAGVGVGGVAVALAAQKTIANLFGGFSLATDQPVRLGDFCRFGDKSGWVEYIGIRSTRIRTLDRSVITVPNAEFAEVQLENLSLRDRMRLQAKLGLRYETHPDQMRHVLEGLRTMLAADPRVIQDPLRVRFVGFGTYSLDIEVMTYIATADADAFAAIREELFLKMMDIVSESGTGFAFPSQTIYAAQDTGLDAERTRAAMRAGRSGETKPS
jgi:MscS family membrane protein